MKPKKAFLVPVNLTISFDEGQIETKDNTSCSVYVPLFFGTSIADGRILSSFQAEAFFLFLGLSIFFRIHTYVSRIKQRTQNIIYIFNMNKRARKYINFIILILILKFRFKLGNHLIYFLYISLSTVERWLFELIEKDLF